MVFLGSLGPTELLLILLIVIIIFGARKLPDLGKSLGDGIKNFKKSMNTKDDDRQVLEEERPSRQLTRHETDPRKARRRAPGEGRGPRPERRFAEGRRSRGAQGRVRPPRRSRRGLEQAAPALHAFPERRGRSSAPSAPPSRPRISAWPFRRPRAFRHFSKPIFAPAAKPSPASSTSSASNPPWATPATGNATPWAATTSA